MWPGPHSTLAISSSLWKWPSLVRQSLNLPSPPEHEALRGGTSLALFPGSSSGPHRAWHIQASDAFNKGSCDSEVGVSILHCGHLAGPLSMVGLVIPPVVTTRNVSRLCQMSSRV
jgi:hypothetical protein